MVENVDREEEEEEEYNGDGKTTTRHSPLKDMKNCSNEYAVIIISKV